MNCHIIPMAYLKDWSTPETRNAKKREDRKIYLYYKNEFIPHLENTEKMACSNISGEGLYMLDDESEKKAIEDYFSLRLENKYGNHLK